MNGIENIEKRILDEANAKADSIIKEAEKKAQAITDQYEEKTRIDTTLINEKNVLLLQDIMLKSRQADGMERRKRLAGKRHELVTEVFSGALDKIVNMDDESYLELLVKLAESVLCDKMGGELLFNKADREKFGQDVVNKINCGYMAEKLGSAKSAVSQMAEDIKKGGLPNVARAASEAVKGFEGKYAELSKDTADIVGGVVIRRGSIEYNCDVSVIIRILSDEMAAEVHDRLFPKGA